jgi:hypothetical protein
LYTVLLRQVHAGGTGRVTRASKTRSSNIQQSITVVFKLLEEPEEATVIPGPVSAQELPTECSPQADEAAVTQASPGFTEGRSEEPSFTAAHHDEDDHADELVFSDRTSQRVPLFQRQKSAQHGCQGRRAVTSVHPHFSAQPLASSRHDVSVARLAAAWAPQAASTRRPPTASHTTGERRVYMPSATDR